MQNAIAQVLTRADLDRFDRRSVVAIGVYRAVARPMKGEIRRDAQKDHAVLRLDDGTDVYIESIDASQSRRDDAETRRFDGKRVQVHGTANALMPSRGQGLIAPCLTDVTAIREDGV